MVADKVMPTLPLSVMNVMDNMRGTQDMIVLGESSVSEASTDSLDYVVSGAQMLDDQHQVAGTTAPHDSPHHQKFVNPERSEGSAVRRKLQIPRSLGMTSLNS